jgi:hypothetical protein
MRVNASILNQADLVGIANSINPSLRLDILDLIRERIFMHRAIIDLHARRIAPQECVFHPPRIVALGEILVGVGAA